MTTPNTEPVSLYTGDTWTWRRTLSHYPASAGWVLKYALANAAGRIDITASASGDEHLVEVSAATTAGYEAGTYAWQSYVEKDGQRFTIGRDQIVVAKGLLAGGTDGEDLRSQAQKALDDATAALAQFTATRGMTQSYTIAGRSMTFRSVAELRQLINFWADRVAQEAAAERARQGLGPRKTLTRFGS